MNKIVFWKFHLISVTKNRHSRVTSLLSPLKPMTPGKLLYFPVLFLIKKSNNYNGIATIRIL